MGIYSVPAKRQGLDLMVSDHKMLNTLDFFLSRIEKKTHYFLVDINREKMSDYVTIMLKKTLMVSYCQ